MLGITIIKRLNIQNRELMKEMKRLSISLIFVFSIIQGSGQFKLPSLINDNMVLQQKTNVFLWGTAEKGSVVEIAPGWTKKKYTSIADAGGNWGTKIPTPSAGGPYEISFDNAGNKTIVKNVLLGEVWVCSGQSNMEMPLKGFERQPVLNSGKIITDAEYHPDIHLFHVPNTVSHVPLYDCAGSWEVSGAATSSDFSAVAYQYARILNDKLHVPIGIITSYWGGTAIQSWMSENNVKKFPEAELSTRPDTLTNPNTDGEKTAAILFNAMIYPLSKYTIKGFTWYQGEANVEHPALYRKLLPAMVAEWRKLWGLGDLPFYYVQIAPYGYYQPNSALLGEAQLQALPGIANEGMAVTTDIGKERYIHPPDKSTVSERLSYWALAKTYHYREISFHSPVFKKMRIKDNKTYLYFDFTGDRLSLHGNELIDFEIAESDRKFYPAKATIVSKNEVEVENANVKLLVAVRYAFKNWVTGHLYNSAGLPASSFRTDNWKN